MNKSMFVAILQPTTVRFTLDSVGSVWTLTIIPVMNALGIHLKIGDFWWVLIRGGRLFQNSKNSKK